MTDRVSMMFEETNTVAVYFTKFSRYANDITKTVCFFEGDDQKYFGIRLDLSKLKTNWSGIYCGGKKNVLDLHKVITNHESYKHSLVAFFIDRDFDNPIPVEMLNLIYETPCYSIENLYCTDHCLSRVLDSEFKMRNNPDKPALFDDACKHFQYLLSQFQEKIRPLNIWIKAHRTKEKNEGCKKLKLNSVALDKFVKVGSNDVISVYTQANIQEYFPGSYSLSNEELMIADDSLPAEDTHLHYRGKYQLEFVRKFLDNLKKDVKDNTSPFYNPGHAVKLSLSKDNIISELSQYASNPDCLSEFIGKLAQRSALVAS